MFSTNLVFNINSSLSFLKRVAKFCVFLWYEARIETFHIENIVCDTEKIKPQYYKPKFQKKPGPAFSSG